MRPIYGFNCFLCAVAALGLTACSRDALGSCLPPGVSYDAANRAYQSRSYVQASREFERLALETQRCARAIRLEPLGKETAASDMLLAAEAAHWGNETVRARDLARKARSLSILFQGEVDVKRDKDAEFALFGDQERAERDQAGIWTLP